MPQHITLSEIAQLETGGKISQAALEISNMTTILKDMKFYESNQIMSDIDRRITTMPKGAFTDLSEGAPVSKGSMEQFTESMAWYEDSSVYERKIQDLTGSLGDAARWEQDQLHLQSGGLEMEKILLYGNSLDPKEFDGFLTRANRLTDMNGYLKNSTKEQNYYTTLDAGGTKSGSLASILIVGKGNMEASCIYPKNMKDCQYGLTYETYPMREVTENGKLSFQAYSYFRGVFGLKVKNRKSFVRIANIDYSDEACLKKLPNLIIAAVAALPSTMRSNFKIYSNKEVTVGFKQLNQSLVTPVVYDGKIMSNPVGNIYIGNSLVTQCDSMLATEERIA